MNRAQRRKAAKQSKHAGRVTPKKDKPTAFATITDENGKVIKRVPVEGEPVTEAQMLAEQRAAYEKHEAQQRLQAHAHGLWLPGDPLQ
jgi:hypothetical protein